MVVCETMSSYPRVKLDSFCLWSGHVCAPEKGRLQSTCDIGVLPHQDAEHLRILHFDSISDSRGIAVITSSATILYEYEVKSIIFTSVLRHTLTHSKSSDYYFNKLRISKINQSMDREALLLKYLSRQL